MMMVLHLPGTDFRIFVCNISAAGNNTVLSGFTYKYEQPRKVCNKKENNFRLIK